MDIPTPRRGFSLDALIAEAKRRARNRRFLVLMLVVAAGAVAAGVTLGSSGGGPGPSRVAGSNSGRSDGSQIAQIGPFSVRVPRGLYWYDYRPPNTAGLLIDNHTSQLAPNYASLQVQPFGKTHFFAPQTLPLDIHKLKALQGSGGVLYTFLSGGGPEYQVSVDFGSNASAADKAAVLQALSAIRRTR